MKFEIIGSLTEFERLEDDWRNLFAGNDQRRNVFASFDWNRAVLNSCWPASSKGSYALTIVVGRRRGKAELICPLVLFNRFGIKELNWIGDPVSQYGDVIAKPGNSRPHLIDAALKFAARETAADAFILKRVRDDAAVAATLKLNDRIVMRRLRAPYIDLEQFNSADDFMASFSRNRRKQHRRLWRRLEERGQVTFATLSPGPDAQLRTKQALDFKTRALKDQRTFSRAFSNPAFRSFFLDLASGKHAGTGFQISCVLSGDTLVAAEIGFKSFDAYMSHIGAYNPAFKKFAPGRLQIERTAQLCFEDGLKRYDFLAPDDEYKQAWSTKSVEVLDVGVPITKAGRVYCNLARVGGTAADTLKKVLPAQLIHIAARK